MTKFEEKIKKQMYKSMYVHGTKAKKTSDIDNKTKEKDDGRFDLLVCDHKGCGHQKQMHSENGCESIFFTADGDYWCNCKKFKNNLMKFL